MWNAASGKGCAVVVARLDLPVRYDYARGIRWPSCDARSAAMGGFVAEVYLRGGEGSDGDQRCRRWRASRELRLSESPSTGIILIHSVP